MPTLIQLPLPSSIAQYLQMTFKSHHIHLRPDAAAASNQRDTHPLFQAPVLPRIVSISANRLPFQEKKSKLPALRERPRHPDWLASSRRVTECSSPDRGKRAAICASPNGGITADTSALMFWQCLGKTAALTTSSNTAPGTCGWLYNCRPGPMTYFALGARFS